MQHVGVHAVLQGQRRNGCARFLAGGDQLCFELCGVGAVCAPRRVARCLRVFEHRVHGQLRAHDLAQTNHLIQDGLASRLLKTGTRPRLNGIGCCDFNLKPVSMWFKEGRVGGADFRSWGSALAAKCNPLVSTHLWLDNGPIHTAKATRALFPQWASKGLHIHFCLRIPLNSIASKFCGER